MTTFWYAITGVGVIAAIINFSIAVARREQRLTAAVRGAAGVVSLLLSAGIVVGKLVLQAHAPFALQWPTEIIGAGVFVFAVLLLPSYADQRKTEAPSMQQRAARPVNATVRLESGAPDEWVN